MGKHLIMSMQIQERRHQGFQCLYIYMDYEGPHRLERNNLIQEFLKSSRMRAINGMQGEKI